MLNYWSNPFLQELSLKHWTSGSSWSSCPNRAVLHLRSSLVLMGAAGLTTQQKAVGRSARKTWPWCWLGPLGPTWLWPSWKSVGYSWSFRLTPNWSVSCWEWLRRGRGGWQHAVFVSSQYQTCDCIIFYFLPGQSSRQCWSAVIASCGLNTLEDWVISLSHWKKNLLK